jgi:inosine-uridine nucleoside N-ribohydrolase
MSHYIQSCKTYIGESPAMHDPCCIAYLENPHMFRFEEAHVGIETQGTLTRGRTVVDFSGLGGMKPNCKVALSVHQEEFWATLEGALRRNA